MENLFNLWAKRNPSWEKRYEDSIMGAFTDYGKRYSQFIDTRGKIFGPGYEIFIIAFFIGLYSNQTKPLTEDKSKVKTFGRKRRHQTWKGLLQNVTRVYVCSTYRPY